MFLDGGWGKTTQNFLGQSKDFGIYSKGTVNPMRGLKSRGVESDCHLEKLLWFTIEICL